MPGLTLHQSTEPTLSIMRSQTIILLASLGATMLCAAPAAAHIEVTNPPTRYQFEPPNSNNQKTGPCATGTPTGVVTALISGEELTVTWNEFIDHPGHFRIALDTSGTDAFVDPASEVDMAITGNIIAYVPDTGGTAFSHTFMLPDVACDFCTIQIMQVMTDKLPWGPANGDDIYYWCSDISLSSGAGGSGAGGSGGAGAGGDTSGSGTGAGAGPSDDDDGDAADGGCAIGGGKKDDRGWWPLLLLACGAARRRRETSCGGAALLMLLTVGCGGAQSRSGEKASPSSSGPRAPDFTLPTLDGGSVTLSDYEDEKVVLVDFWATNCEPCKAEMPEIVRLYEAKKDEGLEVLAVSIDGPETLAALSSYVQRFKMRFPVLLDQETEVFDRYSPKGTMPYTAVIDRGGVIVLRRSGYQAGDETSWKQLVTAVDDALEATP